MKKLFLNKKQKLEGYPDEKILEKYRESGDRLYFEILFERYIHLVFGVALNVLKHQENARDAAMQIFEKLATELNRHEIKNFKSWIHTVTRNHCLMQFRRNKAIVTSLEDLNEKKQLEIVDSHSEWHPVNGENSEERIQKLLGALKVIKPEQADCIRLFYLEKKTYKEIETATGFSAMQVKSHIQNGKRKLRLILQDDEDFRS